MRASPAPGRGACMVERRFAEPVARREDLLSAWVSFSERAATTLEERGQGGRLFEASVFRTDGVVRRIAVGPARPPVTTAALMRLFADEKMHLLDDPSDLRLRFDLIRLSVLRTEALAARQERLDGRDEADSRTVALIDHLVARFHGRDSVLRILDRRSHVPERAEALLPANRRGRRACLAGATRHAAASPAPAALRPAPADRDPRRGAGRATGDLSLAAHHPQITRAEGPERIAAEWWR